jgi:cytochrome c oxidase assembly protein subunit 15
MVASGLVGRVDVAPERLAIRLTMASVILIALVWTARSIAPTPPVAAPGRLAGGAILGLLVGCRSRSARWWRG